MDKNKIIEAAAKLVAKGAYDKAIKEYQKVLEVDPRDVRVLQKMGELFQKKNDNVQAATYFTKVAESYSADGFFLKAVALYKQVQKLNPTMLEVNLKLAELHQQLGLMSEATAYFQIVANAHDKAGDTRASLDTLKRMVDLDPDNVASRIKLAELYAREEMAKEALPEFKRAAEYLKRNSRQDDYLRVAERISALEPENLAVAKELATSYLSKGDQKRALAKLQICFKADGKDVETLNLLAQAFQGLGQTSKTVSVYKELVKVLEERGRHTEAEGVWTRIEVLDPSDPELLERRAPAREAAPAPRAAAPAPRAAAPAPQPPPAPAPAAPSAMSREQLTKVLTETDVYVKYGLHDKALDHLRKIFAVDPENLDAHEKAHQIYVASGSDAQAAEQLLNVLRLCTRRADVERAQPYLATLVQDQPHHPELPGFLAVLRSGEGELPEPLVTDDGSSEDAILVDSNDDEVIVSPAPEDALAQPEGDELALATVTGAEADDIVGDDDVEPVLTGEYTPLGAEDDEPLVMSDDDEPLALVADSAEEEEAVVIDPDALVDAEQDFGGMAEEVIEEVVEDDVESTRVFTLTPELLQRAAPTQSLPTVPAKPAPPPAAAKPAPPPPAAQKPAPPPAAQKPAPQKAAPPPPPPPEPEPEYVAMDEGYDAVVTDEAPGAMEEEPAAEECDEASFFLDQGLLEEAREILETVQIAFPGHARSGELMARLEQLEAGDAPVPPEAAVPAAGAAVPSVQPVGEERDAFDLAAELAEEVDTFAEAEPVTAAPEDFQYSVEEVFAEFKKGLEKVVKPEDVETHYDLGIAYKEMGLVDDAIGEFTVARQGCVGTKREVECLTMVGMLQVMKGDAASAVTTFKEALASEHAAGEATKALGFELAMAQEAAGSPGKALYHYRRVAALDARYRDVSAQVARLAASVQAEEDALPGALKSVTAAASAAGAPKTRKVGYV